VLPTAGVAARRCAQIRRRSAPTHRSSATSSGAPRPCRQCQMPRRHVKPPQSPDMQSLGGTAANHGGMIRGEGRRSRISQGSPCTPSQHCRAPLAFAAARCSGLEKRRLASPGGPARIGAGDIRVGRWRPYRAGKTGPWLAFAMGVASRMGFVEAASGGVVTRKKCRWQVCAGDTAFKCKGRAESGVG